MSISTIAIGRLEAEHLPQAHALSQTVGWPHRLEDWALVLKLGRGFAALSDGELVGTIIWWPFGERHATLGMVVVAPAMQGQGLGRRLMQEGARGRRFAHGAAERDGRGAAALREARVQGDRA